MARTETGHDGFEEERPRKKKKKKKREAAGMSKGLTIALVGGGALFAVGLIVLVIVLVTKSGGKPMVVGSYDAYEAPEFEFRCQYPDGWKVKAGGIKDHRFASFEKGSASIRINQSILGSVIGDTAAASTDPNVSEDRQPVARVHDFKRPIFAEEMGDHCKEEKAQTVRTKGFGNCRRSVFTTSAVFKKTRGYRGTVLATLVSYDIVCQCAESDWPTLEPVFAKVIESIGPGTGE